MNYHLLLTGATGLLGRYLLRDLLDAGISVAVLVRPTRRQTAEERVEAMMVTWEKMLGRKLGRPVVLSGDLTQDDLGLDPEGIEWVKENCDSVMHNAASLTFVATDDEGEPWRSNVTGTRNVLDLCKKTEIHDFHHVSTAYVAGLRQGRVLETELDVGQDLSNDYEKSKVMAEEMVRSADFLSPPTVFRPAIIIGDSVTGFTTTFHGFYAALRLAHTLAEAQERDADGNIGSVETRLTLNGDEHKNLVPVDWVSAVMTHVFTHRELHGETYHLAPDEPVTSRLMADTLEQVGGYYGTQFVGPNTTIDDPTETEALFYQNIEIYDSYWRNDPTFDLTNTKKAAPHLPCPHVDKEMLVRLSQVAIDMNFKFKDEPLPRTSEVS